MSQSPHRLSARRTSLLLGALLCGALCAVPADAEELNCPALTVSTATHTVPHRHQHGLLWRISKQGRPVSHLFGTIHLPDEDVARLPEPVATVFEHSSRFVMEAVLDGADMDTWTRQILEPGGRSLRDELGRALYERSARLLTAYGIPPEAVDLMKPWTVYLTLSTPPTTGGLPLDLALAHRAESAGKKVFGLETVSEQIDSIASLPQDDQVALVKDAVCHYDTVQDDIRRMKQLYLDRDLAGLVVAANRYDLMESPRYQHLMQKLLSERNERLCQRMISHLHSGEAFIAVGALHLPGEHGILGLLEHAGYAIEPVY